MSLRHVSLMRYMVQAFLFCLRERRAENLMEFVIGFMAVWRIMLLVAGGMSAVLVFLLVVATAAFLLGGMFDGCTSAIARRWVKKDYQPKSRLGRIILENHKRLGS